MKKKKTIKNILAHTVLTLLAIVWVSPLVWIILTSFRAQKGAYTCLLYTSPSPRDISGSRMPSSA